MKNKFITDAMGAEKESFEENGKHRLPDRALGWFWSFFKQISGSRF